MRENLLPFYPLTAITLTVPVKGAEAFSVHPVFVKLLTNISTLHESDTPVVAVAEIDGEEIKDSEKVIFFVSSFEKTTLLLSICIILCLYRSEGYMSCKGCARLYCD